MAVKRYVNNEWVTISGLQGPVGETGPVGPTGVFRGNSAPEDTSLLWVDLDDLNSFVPYLAPTLGSTSIDSDTTYTNISGLTINSTTIPTSKTLVVTTDKLNVHAATTSAELAGIISDETGSGALVFGTSPSLTTPSIGVATGTSFNSITGLSSTTPNALGTAAVGTGTTTARADHVHPTTGLGLTASPLSQFAATTSSQLAGVISDETGSGALVFATSPTLVTPALGNATATTINASGSLLWEAASAGSIASRIKTGVYENSAPTVAGGWPETSGWHHLISATHSSTGNYYAAQFTSDFFNSENLWYRSVNGGGALWNRVLQSTIQRAEKTSAYTLVAQDVGRLIEINMAGANTLTVPTNASVPFPVGAQINILQTAGGQVTVGGAGVTINATPGLKLRTQWSSATLIKRATDTWVLVGDLSA